ncbi:hypothetical protein GO986_17870 [Deinococcus sp. HMF7620]|uniref:Uncharacterized protein n=1 Tax=Deinococcus arboris TaxID=2682977 RepID=A0A7C9HTX9_9DEIO|nr:hypothetical protein [Deinococcus arboris]MVN88607.1 hypothetical protein [Deinococcus arboris]
MKLLIFLIGLAIGAFLQHRRTERAAEREALASVENLQSQPWYTPDRSPNARATFRA